MNRREFLYLAFGAAAGGGLLTLTYNNRRSPDVGIDVERQLLLMYNKQNENVTQRYPLIKTYESALDELVTRGLVKHGQLDTERLRELRSYDEIVDFNGWMHLESELILFLAAQLLVDQYMIGRNRETPRIAFDEFLVIEGLDFDEGFKAVQLPDTNDYTALVQCLEICREDTKCRGMTLGKRDHSQTEKQNVCWLVSEDAVPRQDSRYFGAIRR